MNFGSAIKLVNYGYGQFNSFWLLGGIYSWLYHLTILKVTKLLLIWNQVKTGEFIK